LGKSTITLENFTKERIPNNLYTKELVARLAFNDLENNK
jgi:hypothetical protein